ncbi:MULTISPECIES: siderophore-interacting protein [Arthrobacter]|uniref:Siderophore-interacting protein n=2 Tax=Arthrobacter TaxID=1663 RepID=A0ABU9KJB0_9MICC|nr:siderophore-interacting protein [Arthrobacter sp. YJM1]MDP5226774.1 siderophore-interacting protein [Arthrobacter sp. YJM1]
MSGTQSAAGIAAVEPMAIAFPVRVTAVREVGVDYRRITFGGYSLRQFGVHGELLDTRIKLIIPPRVDGGWGEPVVIDAVDDGWYRQWLALPEDVRGSMRTYSVRAARLDAAYPEIDVDFVLHGVRDDGAGRDGGGYGASVHGAAGPAAAWAAEAQVGDRMTVIGPNNRAAHCITAQTYGGIEWRPGLAQRILLAGDETAVPAICAILESLPAYLSGQAFLEVPEAGDFQDVRTDADVEITWLARGASRGRARPHGEVLQEAVRRAVPLPGHSLFGGPDAARAGAGAEPAEVDVDTQILWDTPQLLDPAEVKATRVPGAPSGALPFYAWVAGEAGVVKEIRRYLVRDVGLDRKQVAFMGYWRHGKVLD